MKDVDATRQNIVRDTYLEAAREGRNPWAAVVAALDAHEAARVGKRVTTQEIYDNFYAAFMKCKSDVRDSLNSGVAAILPLLQCCAPTEADTSFVDIVFDGPPAPEAGRFVGVEDHRGRSIRFGEWVKRNDDMWALRIRSVAPRAPVAHEDAPATKAQIKHMVDRFLAWALPKDFSPDNGISCSRPNYHPSVAWELTGTNLLNAVQAEAMVRHMLDGMPTSDAPRAPVAEVTEEMEKAASDFFSAHYMKKETVWWRGLLQAALAAAPHAPATEVINEIAAERRRQAEAEGWTPEHDDEHSRGEMAIAAACYAEHAASERAGQSTTRGVDYAHRHAPDHWPWSVIWWKPKNARRDLIRAAALIVAEIERLDRAAPRQPEHASGCAPHNAPALPPGPCDCRDAADRKIVEAAKELLDPNMPAPAPFSHPNVKHLLIALVERFGGSA